MTTHEDLRPPSFDSERQEAQWYADHREAVSDWAFGELAARMREAGVELPRFQSPADAERWLADH